jgi:hypothetical protein
MTNYQNEHAIELASIPKDYSIEMALQHNDIVENVFLSYNTQRLLEFIENMRNGVPDKVRISSFGIDNPLSPTISILQYNGEMIIYTIDTNRGGLFINYVTYYEPKIELRKRTHKDIEILDFYLITYDNRDIFIFHERI